MSIKEQFVNLDARLAKMPRRRLIPLMLAVAVVFVAIGSSLGLLWVNQSANGAPVTADGDSSSDDSDSEATSINGVLRRLSEAQDGIEFYLEKWDETRVLLDTADRFASDFLQANVGLIVTVEGAMKEATIGGESVFLVEKLVVSF